MWPLINFGYITVHHFFKFKQIDTQPRYSTKCLNINPYKNDIRIDLF